MYIIAVHIRRSIPACAGEPSWGVPAAAWARVYPRVCGGTFIPRKYQVAPVGLSPRVRGNLGGISNQTTSSGSIPACAGEPGGCCDGYHQREVYPRVCGGTSRCRMLWQWNRGLSPRVRGNQNPAARASAATGSIPACAGEPRRGWRPAGASRVYPRVCGGTAPSFVAFGGGSGLSPRVRGNLRHRHSQPDGVGSIPACAGEPHWKV